MEVHKKKATYGSHMVHQREEKFSDGLPERKDQ